MRNRRSPIVARALALVMAVSVVGPVVGGPRSEAVMTALPSRSIESTAVSPSLESRLVADGVVDPLGRTLSARPDEVPPLGAAPDDEILDAGGLEPSVQAVEAAEHLDDEVAFTPGARVERGFAPAPGDRWTVEGMVPGALPAGRLDGRELRKQGTPPIRLTPRRNRPAPTSPASLPAATDALDAEVDLPTGSGAAAAAGVPASLASYTTTDATPSPAVAPTAAITPAGLRREIFGFLPYWELNDSSLRIDYRKVSTIAYFGVGVDTAGNLLKRNADGSTSVGWSGWTSSKLTSVISTAHANHTRVVLTVQSFGWTSSGLAAQKALLGSSTARLTLARQIAAAVRDRGADGVNLDFEPLATGAETQFTALVRTIRAELNRVHSGYQLTFDTTGKIGNYPIEAATASGGADAIFVMGYDYRTGGSSPVGSVAPYDRSGYGVLDTVAAYTARVPASKVILGVPYYGRAWSTATNTLNAANTSSATTGASTTVTYDTAADYLARYGRKWDPLEKVAWTAYRRQNCTSAAGCVTSWRELYVDDAAALSAKYDLVNTYGLRGAGIWALGYDGTRPELWGAIQQKFITDTTPPVAAIRTLPARELNPAFPVAWTGRDDVAVASYDVQVSADGGAWAGWLSATKSTSATFPGRDAASYAFRVRARDAHGNVSPWNVTSTATAAGTSVAVGGFGLVRVDGLAIRSAADTSATKLGTFAKDAVVAIVDGPRSADGYRWFRVMGPLSGWGPTTSQKPGWVAVTGSGTTLVTPVKPPNATHVGAALGGLGFAGAGAASVGTSAAAIGLRSFSPNADGVSDTLRINWVNDRAFDRVVVRVFRADGTKVGDVGTTQLAKGARQIAWNGRVGSTALPNGRYLLALVGTSGGTTFANPASTFSATGLAGYGVTIDTVAPTVTSATLTGGTLISPNGDGRLDSIAVAVTASGATGWAVGVARVSGTSVGAPIFVRSGSGTSASVRWAGVDSSGAAVRDGTYRIQVVLFDAAGNRASRSWTVRVDRTAPVLALTTPRSFSPNGDGTADTARLAWTASEHVTGTIRVERGTTIVRSWAITKATSGAVGWNGRTASGAAVADGTYTVRVTGRDAAGNAASTTSTVVVDRTLSTLRWSAAGFYPQDGDAITARSTISVALARTAVVTGGIYAGTTLVRPFWSNVTLKAGPHGWTWDGRTASGTFVKPGVYTARVSARTALGTTTLTRSIVVDAFDVTLSATTLRAGGTLTVTLRTIEPLRTVPTVTFSQAGRTAVRKTATSLGSGRYRVTFAVLAGSGPARIDILARDSANGVNRSSRLLTVL